jgi:hypothetical protein
MFISIYTKEKPLNDLIKLKIKLNNLCDKTLKNLAFNNL